MAAGISRITTHRYGDGAVAQKSRRRQNLVGIAKEGVPPGSRSSFPRPQTFSLVCTALANFPPQTATNAAEKLKSPELVCLTCRLFSGSPRAVARVQSQPETTFKRFSWPSWPIPAFFAASSASHRLQKPTQQATSPPRVLVSTTALPRIGRCMRR
jgi:hypothetical protein